MRQREGWFYIFVFFPLYPQATALFSGWWGCHWEPKSCRFPLPCPPTHQKAKSQWVGGPSAPPALQYSTPHPTEVGRTHSKIGAHQQTNGGLVKSCRYDKASNVSGNSCHFYPPWAWYNGLVFVVLMGELEFESHLWWRALNPLNEPIRIDPNYSTEQKPTKYRRFIKKKKSVISAILSSWDTGSFAAVNTRLLSLERRYRIPNPTCALRSYGDTYEPSRTAYHDPEDLTAKLWARSRFLIVFSSRPVKCRSLLIFHVIKLLPSFYTSIHV